MANITSINAGQAVVKLLADNNTFAVQLRESQNYLQAFVNGAANLGTRLSILGIGFTGPFKNAVSVFAEFDDKMRSVQAVTASTGEAFNRLTEQAKQLGASTSYTAGQVADGMAALGRMGFDSSKIESSIKPMMDLATATGTELAAAAEIASNNMAVFGIKASQATKVADILAITANSSAQTLTDLGEALKTAGPISKEVIAKVSSKCMPT